MTPDEFASLALSLPGVIESAHFGKRDFRAGTIFASLPSENTGNLKLTPDQQQWLLVLHPPLFSALPNAWGLRGWTTLHLPSVEREVALQALEMAWKNVTAKKSGKR